MSYAAGLALIPVWKTMVATLIGMAPLCFLQAYFAQELTVHFPRLIYFLVPLGILYAIYSIRLLHKLLRRATLDQSSR